MMFALFSQFDRRWHQIADVAKVFQFPEVLCLCFVGTTMSWEGMKEKEKI